MNSCKEVIKGGELKSHNKRSYDPVGVSVFLCNIIDGIIFVLLKELGYK